MFTEVFDDKKMIGRRLSVRRTVAVDKFMDGGSVAGYARRYLAEDLAHKILEGPPFFTCSGATSTSWSTYDYRAECIVLTVEEYNELKRASFVAGEKHARGYLPPY